MTALSSIVLAGAAVVPAMPLEARTWFTSKEHPRTALMVAGRGHLPYRIVVAPDGTAIRCETPGTTELERKVCEIVMKRARFTPARDVQGRPVFGVHDAVASFLMPGRNTRPDRAALAVTVDGLPGGAASPAYASVAFLVDGAGTVGACGPVAGGERRRFQQNVAALAPAACEKVMADHRPLPARDAEGEAVPSVQTVTVRFELRPPSG